jgi:hypothetical protein
VSRGQHAAVEVAGEKAATIGERIGAVKKEIEEERSWQANDVHELAMQYRKIEPAVGKWRSLVPEYRSAMDSVADAARNTGTLGPLYEQADLIRELCTIDAAQAEQLAKQIALSKEMERLPVDKQFAFYKARIWPVIEEENAIVARKEPVMQTLRSLKDQLTRSESE